MLCISRKICEKCHKYTLQEGYAVLKDGRIVLYEYECLECSNKSIVEVKEK